MESDENGNWMIPDIPGNWQHMHHIKPEDLEERFAVHVVLP